MSDSAGDELAPDLRAFVYACIDAVEQVEILSFLGGSASPRSAQAVGVALGLPVTAARHHLETLVARGLLQIAVGDEVSYSYAPKTMELRRYADLLINQYARSRSAILRFIASNPRRLRRFSDAFKLRDPD